MLLGELNDGPDPGATVQMNVQISLGNLEKKSFQPFFAQLMENQAAFAPLYYKNNRSNGNVDGFDE